MDRSSGQNHSQATRPSQNYYHMRSTLHPRHHDQANASPTLGRPVDPS